LKAGGTTLALREQLAAAAFAHTAAYDAAIATWFGRHVDPESAFPPAMFLWVKRDAELRYGENPHQKGAVYVAPGCAGVSVLTARQLHGKELWYNNLLDLDSALSVVRLFVEPAASVIKHNNPCGSATAASLADAAQKALDGDPQSAFGGVLAFNRNLDAATAERLAAPGLFIEAIAAPDFEPEALQILTTKPKWKANVRLLAVGTLDIPPAPLACRPMEGGMLVQEADVATDPESEWKVVTQEQPSDNQLIDLRFGWAVVRHVKSNAIVLAKGTSLIGCGAGQMSRVDSVEIAI